MPNARVRRTRARMTLGQIAHTERQRHDRWDIDLAVSQATWASLQVTAGPEVAAHV